MTSKVKSRVFNQRDFWTLQIGSPPPPLKTESLVEGSPAVSTKRENKADEKGQKQLTMHCLNVKQFLSLEESMLDEQQKLTVLQKKSR